MKKIVLLIALSFASFVLMSHIAQAYDETIENYQMRVVTSDTLPLKSAQSPRSTTILTLNKNDVVYQEGKPYAGWVYVRISNQPYIEGGYVNSSLLSEVKGYGNPIGKRTTVINKISMNHVATDTNGYVLNSFKKGDLVKTDAMRDGYRNKITSVGLQQITGIIHPAYLQYVPPTIRMTTSKSGIVVKQKPSPSSKTLLTIPQNMSFESYGQVAGGWRIIQYGDTIGYVNGAAAVAAKSTKQYVTAEGLPVYYMPTRTADVRQVLIQGAEVQVYSSSQGWSYVQIGRLGGYVPTNMLSAKKPKLAKDVGLQGLKMDVRAIKPNITQTESLKNEKGQTVYVHTTTFGLGVQLAGSNAVYIQQNTGKYTAIAKQLEKETGVKMFACNRYVLCQYEKGKLVEVISSVLLDRYETTVHMNAIGKGQVQFGWHFLFYGGEEDYEYLHYETYAFDATTKKLKQVGVADYDQNINSFEDVRKTFAQKKIEFDKWMTDSTYVIQEALPKK